MKRNLILLALLFLGSVGCGGFRDRLLFVEETHLGLIARVSPDETSPADVDFGYRRTLVTVTPQQNVDLKKSTQDQAQDNNGEIMSVISSFTAKVSWFNATEVHTYFATGEAATNASKSPIAIKGLTAVSK